MAGGIEPGKSRHSCLGGVIDVSPVRSRTFAGNRHTSAQGIALTTRSEVLTMPINFVTVSDLA